MSTKSTAREQILGRIRAALRDVPSNEQPQDVVVPLDYRRSETAPREEVVERFVERVAEYKVNVQRVDEASLPAAIAAACTARNVRHLVIPTDLPGQWLPGGVELLHDDNTLTNEQPRPKKGRPNRYGHQHEMIDITQCWSEPTKYGKRSDGDDSKQTTNSNHQPQPKIINR